MPLDAHELARVTADMVKAHTAPLLRRIEALEGREPARGEQGDKGDQGAQGPSGVGVAGAMIDRSGVLILTLSNGETRDLGSIVGKDGEKGEVGERGEQGQAGERGEIGVQGNPGDRGEKGETGPRGDDGPRGEAGVKGDRGDPGFGLDAFDIEAKEDGRTIELRFDGGDTRHTYELCFPVVIDRGVWKEGEYKTGDGVTWGGSWWIAQKDTTAKPDSPDSGWRLAVKKGRDGKDAPKA